MLAAVADQQQVGLAELGAAVRAVRGARRVPGGSSGSPASQCAPCIAHGTTCSRRQKTAPRSPACSRRAGSRRRAPPDCRTRCTWRAVSASGMSALASSRIDSAPMPDATPHYRPRGGPDRPGAARAGAARCSTRRLPASTLELEHYDLSLENRRTHRQRGRAAPRRSAMREAGYGIKAATITPEGADDVGSPNTILREADRRQGDHPHRPPHPRRARRWPASTTRSRSCGWRSRTPTAPRSAASRENGDEVAFRTERIAPLDLPRGRRVLVPHRRAHARACLRRAEVDRQPDLRGDAEGGARRRRRAPSGRALPAAADRRRPTRGWSAARRRCAARDPRAEPRRRLPVGARAAACSARSRAPSRCCSRSTRTTAPGS